MIRTETPEIEIHSLSAHTFDGMTEHPWAGIIGRRALYRTAEGIDLVGVVEEPTRFSSGYPIVRFDDGRWGRCDDEIRVLS